MTQSNLLKLAKQGNAKAIAAMLNQSLQPKSITAKVGRKDDCLQILLESAQTPNQQAMVSFIRNGLIKLEIESIKTVKVYSRQTGEESLVWNQSFEIASQREPPSITEQTDLNNLLTYQTPHKTSRPVSPTVETPSSIEQTDFQNPRQSPTKSHNPSPRQPIGHLSVGNVVSAGIRLYRDHFKLYFGLAFIAYLWVLVPIYGWAKFSARLALLSRLAFSETIEQPEKVDEARRHVNPRMWSFLLAGFLVYLIYTVLWMLMSLGFTILTMVIGFTITSGGAFPIIPILLAVIFVLALLLGFLWLAARLFIVEVPLAIENNVNASSTIGRSWKLTKGFALRLIMVLSVAFLISLPLSIPVQIFSQLAQQAITVSFPRDSVIFGLLSFLLFVGVTLVSGSILMPFWQAIKGVVYYDLRSRREGLDMQLRDSHLR